MEIVLIVLALLLAAAGGFALGLRVDHREFKAQVARARRVRRTPAVRDFDFVPGFPETRPPAVRFPAVLSDDVTFPAAHVGDVYVTLWVPRDLPVADVTVNIEWGSMRGTIDLKALDVNGVALCFKKRTAKDKDVVVRVITSLPTCRIADTQPATEGIEIRKDIKWS